MKSNLQLASLRSGANNIACASTLDVSHRGVLALCMLSPESSSRCVRATGIGICIYVFYGCIYCPKHSVPRSTISTTYVSSVNRTRSDYSPSSGRASVTTSVTSISVSSCSWLAQFVTSPMFRCVSGFVLIGRLADLPPSTASPALCAMDGLGPVRTTDFNNNNNNGADAVAVGIAM